ncbi:nucleophile aminohydrolase [Truncatella angustata]|uniref:Nucleophile aminohydrolase n=1 Tax=Truncatella angustata TaxID=152316 RepID=A0A9P8UFA1_9PEZI|nr:nucleophile aminohydrolase [Truncatella angustata]KAH6648854.1 nucleophile aminohydrolase [Truncatella angustata]
MCRFLLYRGSDEILLSKLILDPTHSILKQSFDSRLRLDTTRGKNNADGFGIGWYTDPKLGAAPCLFTSVIPAWNCTNLTRIASKTASRLVFAHVRATTEGSVTEDNCHPFYHGSLMFMHNGGLGGWKYIKRRLGEKLHDKWYLSVQGGTDSEWSFALFLDRLERLGLDPSSQPEEGFSPSILRKALLQTIEIINELTMSISESVVQSENVDTRSLLNFAVTDGHSVVCTRYVSSKTDEAASLYYSSGTQWESKPSPNDVSQGRDYQMERRDKGSDVVLVASEPLTFERENWVNVPTNSILTIHRQSVMVHPIEDGFSEKDPYHKRSSAFATKKGLTTNEKPAPTIPDNGLATPAAEQEPQKRSFGPLIPTNSRTKPTEPNSLPVQVVARVKSPLAATQNTHSISQNVPEARTTRPEITAKQASQGNIKKKRRSLMAGEWAHPTEYLDSEGQQLSIPDSPPTRASEYGNNEKAARILGLAL